MLRSRRAPGPRPGFPPEMSAPPSPSSLHTLLLSELPAWMDSLRSGLIAHLPLLVQAGAPAASCADVAAVVRQHLPLWTAETARALHDWPESAPFHRTQPGAGGFHDEGEAEASAALLRLAEALEAQQAPRLARLRERLGMQSAAGTPQAGQHRQDPLQPEGLIHAVWLGSAALDLAPPSRYLLLQAAAGPMLTLAGSALGHLEAHLPPADEKAQPAVALDPSLLRRARPAGPPATGLPLYRAGALDSLRLAIQPRVEAVGPEVASSLRELDEMICRIVSAPGPVTGPEGSSRLPNPVLDSLPWIQSVARYDSDRQVIELIAQLFEVLQQDPQLPRSVRQRLGLLQLPVLRTALAEPRVLDSAEHPAWRLIDRIGRHTLGFSDPQDPRLLRAAEGIEWVCDRLSTRERPTGAAFESALGVLEQILAGELALERQQRGADREHALRERQLRRAQTVQRRRIQARLMEQEQVRGEPLQALLRAFLLGVWPRVLAQAALDEDEGPQVFERLDRVLTPLLHTLAQVGPDGQELMDPLLERVQQGCADAGVPPARHEAVSACVERLAGRRLPAPEAGPPAADDGSDLLHAAILGSFFDLGQPLDEPVPEAVAHAPRDWLHRLQPGDWCRMPVDGRWRVLRLLEGGPGERVYLFSEAARDGIHAFSARALERLMLAGLAGPYESRSLLERTVDGLLARGH